MIAKHPQNVHFISLYFTFILLQRVQTRKRSIYFTCILFHVRCADRLTEGKGEEKEERGQEKRAA